MGVFTNDGESKLQEVFWIVSIKPALESTQGQMDDFFVQFSCKCHLEEVSPVGD
jgi:hypothetical protein